MLIVRKLGSFTSSKSIFRSVTSIEARDNIRKKKINKIKPEITKLNEPKLDKCSDLHNCGSDNHSVTTI